MGELIYLTIEELILLIVAIGSTLIGALTSKSFAGWLGEVFNVLTVPIKAAVRLAEYIGHFMKPAYDSVEKRVTGWFAANGELVKYGQDSVFRTKAGVWSVAYWANGKLRTEIITKALAQAHAADLKNALTKAPTIPQRRITQKEVDIEFQRLIETQFVTHLKDDFPKFDWDKNKWKKWLGVLPALGGAVVGPPKTTPTPVPAPKPVPVKTTVPIQPPQPTTLPHTDDQPHPEPGTQVIPGVISAKDKVARGQIQTLKKVETNRWKHLGPLAFLAIPAAGIATLVGLLECKNISRLQKPFCNISSEIIDALLGLAIAAMTVVELCNIAQVAADAVKTALPALEELLLVEDAVCLGGGAAYPSAYIPGNFSSKIVPLSVI